MRIAVTGSSGFVGQALCRSLVDSGHEVVGLTRANGDLADRAADWGPALKGAHAVVHLAALAHERAEALERARDYEALRLINAEGTERLGRQAADAGVQRFVFTSTIGVCGDETSDAPFDENSPPAPRSFYAASKLDAEERLARVSGDTGLGLTVLRPTLVYGPDNGGNFLRLLRLVSRVPLLPFASIRNRRNLTYVGNLVAAIGAVLASKAADGVFVVCDSEAVSTARLIDCVSRGMNRPMRQLAVPAGWLRIAAKLAGREAAARRLLGSLEADNSRLRSIGWTPALPAEAALRETAAWFARAMHRSDGE